MGNDRKQTPKSGLAEAVRKEARPGDSAGFEVRASVLECAGPPALWMAVRDRGQGFSTAEQKHQRAAALQDASRASQIPAVSCVDMVETGGAAGRVRLLCDCHR